jgi:hypothetical protein
MVDRDLLAIIISKVPATKINIDLKLPGIMPFPAVPSQFGQNLRERG